VCRLWLARRAEERRLREDEHHLHELDCSALCCAKSGQTARVVRFCDEHEAARLRDLGVVEGAQVSVVRDGDPLLVRVGDARFGIGRSAAMNVMCHLDS
jgi:Fe2+ transport system protein FeoA